MMIPTEHAFANTTGNQSDNDGVDLLRASHCAVFGAELSKDKTVKCININLLKYKLNKTHEGISEMYCPNSWSARCRSIPLSP